MLKLIFKPLKKYYMTKRASRIVAYEEGCFRLKVRMFLKWNRFRRYMRHSKRKFLKRVFIRRVHYIVRAWRAYAEMKGRKKRAADRQFRKYGIERGFENWRNFFVEHSRRTRFGQMIYRRRVRRVLLTSIRSWYTKVIINRRLLRRVFKIGIESSRYLQALGGKGGPKTEFMLLHDIVTEWRKAVKYIIRERDVRIKFDANSSMRKFEMIGKLFLTWQRFAYVKAVSREYAYERMMRVVRSCFCRWEKWSYKVARLRHKTSVLNVERVWFGALVIGTGVSRMNRRVTLKRFWSYWMEDWVHKWVIGPITWRNRNLLKLVFREWKWCAKWGVAERKCTGSVEDLKFEYNPFLKRHEYLHMARDADPSLPVPGDEVAAVPPAVGGSGGLPTPLRSTSSSPSQFLVPVASFPPRVFGTSAVKLYRDSSLLRRHFNWWTGISARRRHLRRNLGKLSRLANRYKMKDGFDKFPGAGNWHKVNDFAKRRLLRKIFKEWTLLSKSYIKRTQDEGLRHLLREKGRKDLLKKLNEEEIRRMGTDDEAREGRSFLAYVGVGSVGRLGKAWRGWREQAAMGRQQRFLHAKRVKARNKELVRHVFMAWVDNTHFIFRRHSWTASRTPIQPLTLSSSGFALRDRSLQMMSFMNSLGKASTESSFVAKSSQRLILNAGIGSAEIVDGYLDDMEEQYRGKRER